MVLNDYTVEIKKSDGIYSLTFVADKFSGLFLHPLILSDIHSRSGSIINGTLSDS